jgi:transposase
MVTDEQVRLLMKWHQKSKSVSQAAAKAGMDEKTARTYIQSGKLPSQVKVDHTWRTRPDPFVEVWDEIRSQLDSHPGLEAKTLFEDLQRKDPGQFQDGQLRTLQRRIKAWRALEGPEQEVFFTQDHKPGDLCQSDFTHLTNIDITIAGQPFPHLLYHFVLTYSNWETGSICFSENFESLSEGLQNALWELGGVPQRHQSDRLTAAVQPIRNEESEEFTTRYQSLLRHYGLKGQAIQAGRANENGDVEQRHHRFKRALEQALLLRGSREFANRQEYEAFLRKLFQQLNAGRQNRLQDELAVLRKLPPQRLNDCKRLRVKVGIGSTIQVLNNTYSVASRLIGEQVEVRVYAQQLEVWYAQRCVETLPRLRGQRHHRIDYRHIIGWLVRKPGAFANYRYRSDLFPSSVFRIVYDLLQSQRPTQADREYLTLLSLAAKEGESRVEAILAFLLEKEELPLPETVQSRLKQETTVSTPATSLHIEPVNLSLYDGLLESEEVSVWYH